MTETGGRNDFSGLRTSRRPDSESRWRFVPHQATYLAAHRAPSHAYASTPRHSHQRAPERPNHQHRSEFFTSENPPVKLNTRTFGPLGHRVSPRKWPLPSSPVSGRTKGLFGTPQPKLPPAKWLGTRISNSGSAPSTSLFWNDVLERRTLFRFLLGRQLTTGYRPRR